MGKTKVKAGVLAGAALAVGLYYAFQPQDPAAFALRLQTGDAFHYQLHYTSEGSGQLEVGMPRSQAGLSMPEKTVRIQIQSKLHLKVLQQNEAGYQIKFTLEPEHWVYDIPQAENLERPSRISGTFQLAPEGQIEEFRMNELQYQQYGFALADILSLLEFEVGSGETEWTGTERSFRGESPVRFQQKSGDREALRLQKSYVSQPQILIEGGTDYSISAEHLYQSIHAQRQRRFSDGSGTQMTDNTSLDLIVTQERLADSTSQDPVPTVSETLRGATYQKKVEEAMAVRRVGNKSTADVKFALESLTEDDVQKKADAYMLLRAYLLLHPEAVGEFTSYLLDLPYSSQACRTVAAVFSDVGTAQSQKALMFAIDESDDDLNRKEKLIAHLGIVERISPEAENKLYALAAADGPDRVKGAAELAVGVVGGNHLAQGQEAGLERALRYGETRLKEATQPRDREHALRILGNVGAPQQVTLIKPYLSEPVESTRREAIRALRAVNSPEAHGILMDVLKSDPSDVMRHAAIESLSSQAQSSAIFEYLKQQLFVEKDDRVIKQIVSHLVNMRATYPDVKKILEQYLENCGKTSVCGFTSSALASM